ncbi:WAP four-disulfide core domain protein 3-like isoform X2 [Hyla sarda]|uniref:WAP four-disulfide core domain protein 3-like isoform X2 n=1 Tax=Hyla sarda TaxID=327740 RepID=UPI0024C2A4C3|nr:WAP four-disulfide core domain protein 3-like isoform X2 [Hyla sarda]
MLFYSVKPGTCPLPITRCAATLKGNCTTDSDCSGNLKCCTPVCTPTCTRPLPEKIKPGNCPVVNALIGCSIPGPKPGCFIDENCPGDQKCCKPICSWTCTKPVKDKGKPGKCPVVNTFVPCSTPAPKPLCRSDQNCSGKKKCCNYGCQIMCTDPEL